MRVRLSRATATRVRVPAFALVLALAPLLPVVESGVASGPPATIVAAAGPVVEGVRAVVPGPPGGPTPAAGVDFYYAAGEISGDPADAFAPGATATFTVEDPGQVPGGSRSDHSLAELAVENPAMTYSYVEAGWIVRSGRPPKLFVFWWDEGVPKCYDQGCGYVAKGHGLQPGQTLVPGTTITLAWRHRHHKWWLEVDGKRSGYYPDEQWTNAFTETGFAQVFGEVAVDQGYPVCDDMGNGKDSRKVRAASISEVAFLDAPPAELTYDIDDPEHGYTVSITGPDSLRYGGPGLC